jgi:cytochrome c5
MRSRLFAVVVINLFALTLWFADPASASEVEMAQEVPDNPVVMSDESDAGGVKIFVQFCRACHGTGRVGDGPGAPLTCRLRISWTPNATKGASTERSSTLSATGSHQTTTWNHGKVELPMRTSGISSTI